MRSDFSADVNAVLGINADVAAVLDSGRILMFEVGLPGMDIPGYAIILSFPSSHLVPFRIMSLGPKFQLHIQCKLTVDLSIGARIGIGYQVKNAQIYYPQVSDHYSTVESVGLKNSRPFFPLPSVLKLSSFL